jgi:glutamate synthase (NADPH/NADH) small chain
MPEQAPEIRRHNVDEVPLGFDELAARLEAFRCLDCKTKPCVKGCPVHIDIPGFVTAIRDGDFQRAISVIRESNCLPAVTGRVCPQEVQCQAFCTVGKSLKDVNESVSIGRLERFVADWERTNNKLKMPELPPKSGKRVAVVGSGPAGLTVAGDLVRMGHDVTVFEAFHKFGGVLVYGIPEFRLPKAIVASEAENLDKLGVTFEPNVVIGQTITIDELLEEEGFDAVFVGTGAGLPYFMRIPGEELIGVYSANEYLTRANLMQAYTFPLTDTPTIKAKNVAVFGGGNVAMDSARTALRLGAKNVYLVYRRSEAEMPARAEEAHHAREEGVQFLLLTNPVEILGNDKGWVEKIKVLKMELGEPDASGRRRPVPIKDSEYTLEVDTVIEAIGNGPNPLVPSTTPGLATNKWGNITANPESAKTSKPGVFAGGDIVLGAATVILAMGEGRKAAAAIDEFLKTGQW